MCSFTTINSSWEGGGAHDLLCVCTHTCVFLGIWCFHEYQKETLRFLFSWNLKMVKSLLTQDKGTLIEQCASSGIFLWVWNDKSKLIFSLQLLPADISKASSSQQGESFLLHWVAVWPEDDFSQREGQYGRVLQEKRRQIIKSGCPGCLQHP